MIPQELKRLRQWVAWRYEEKDGKRTKIPYSVKGNRASTTNPKDWSDYETVHRAVVIDDHMHLGKFSGMGFVFTKDDPYIGIDWDHCINNGETDKDVVYELSLLQSFFEISPSGKGVHAIVRGILPTCKHRGNGREIYDRGRFFTMTGNGGGEIKPISGDTLQYILDKIDPPSKRGIKSVEFETAEPFKIEDADAIIQQCMINDRFKELYNGYWRGNYKSQSEADFAFCAYIADYSHNPALIRYCFTNSKLYRKKFDGKYGKLTINAVLTGKLLKEILEEL